MRFKVVISRVATAPEDVGSWRVKRQIDRWLEGVVSGVRLDVTGALHGLVGAGRPGAFGRSGVPEDEMNLALTTCKPSAIRCRTQDWRWDMVMAQRVAVRVGCKLVPHSAIP